MITKNYRIFIQSPEKALFVQNKGIQLFPNTYKHRIACKTEQRCSLGVQSDGINYVVKLNNKLKGKCDVEIFKDSRNLSDIFLKP